VRVRLDLGVSASPVGLARHRHSQVGGVFCSSTHHCSNTMRNRRRLYKFQSTVHNLLYVRFREGYALKRIKFDDENYQHKDKVLRTLRSSFIDFSRDRAANTVAGARLGRVPHSRALSVRL